MADTHNPELDLTEAREPLPPSEQRENRRLALTTVWLVLGLLAMVIVGTYLVMSHRAAHTTALTPGQPQKPPVVALISGDKT